MKTELNSIIASSNLARPIRQMALKLVGFLVFGLAVSSAPAVTITWTGTVSSYWTNSANWTPAQVPTNGDTVIINSGTVTFATNSQFAILNVNGGNLAGPVVVASACVLNWTAGRFAQGSSLLVQSNASINLQGSAGKDLAAPMTNFGHVVWSEGTLTVMNNNSSTYAGSVVNLGLWEMAGDVTLQQWWSTDYGTFGNGGIFRKSAGTGTGVINLPFLNSFGAIEVWSGTLRFDHGQQLDGLFSVDAGAVVQWNGGVFSYTPPGRFMGDGQYQLTGGTLMGLADDLPNLRLLGGTIYLSPTFQTDGTIASLDLDGATLAGTNRISGVLNVNSGYVSGSLTVLSNGVLNWSGGRFTQTSSLLVASNGLLNLQTAADKELGGPLTNYGAVIWSAGTFTLRNDGASYAGLVHNSGHWETRGDLSLSRFHGNDYAIFRNFGLLRKAAGTGTSTVGVVTLNEGALEPLSGTLSFTRGLSSPAGSVSFGLSGSGSFGQISVTGTAGLNGSLRARLLDGYIPEAGQSFPVLSAGGLSGSFTNTDGLKVGFGRVLSPAYSATTVTLQTGLSNGVNTVPSWTAVPNFSLREGQTLVYTNQVSDPNGDMVLFRLLNGPGGATVNLTNGVLSWTPSEAQGGSSNYFTVRAFDSGNPSLSVTQSFYALVLETNSAPALAVIGPQLVGVGGVLTVTNTAVDADVPGNGLTYSLLSAPAGASVDTNGVITWTPGTPGTYQVTMRVADSGTPALSATNTFTVGVVAQGAPPAGLVSWWTGDGTTADKNGLNDGALSGNASYGAGLFGQAFSFKGGYLTVLDSPSLDFAPGSAMTVEMWVKRTQAGAIPYYFGKRVSCGAYNYQSPSDLFSAGTIYDPPVGQWRHYAWVFTGPQMLGYVNGSLVYRIDTTLGPTNAASLFIGTSGTCGQTFVGLMDEVRLYNRALSEAEVQGVYGGQNVGVPVLTEQPSSQMAVSGSTVVLRASATGNAPLSYQWWYNGALLAGQTLSSLTLSGVTVAQSGNYWVVVSNALGVTASDTAGLTVMDAPQITVQPESQIGVVGGSASFTVAASGTPTPVLSYQWRKGGVPLSGMTGTTLSLNNLQATDAGGYDVVVVNWAGSAVSHVATLSVSTPIVWTGAISTDWNNRTNWNPQQVPGSADTAVINAGNVVASNAQFYALNFTGGTLSGPLAIASNCLMYWSGGRLAQGSSLTVQSSGQLYLTGSGQKELGGRMTNEGAVVWSGGTFSVMNNNSDYRGWVTNRGLWEMQGDLTLANYWDNVYGSFGNGGTWRKSGGAGVGVISLPFLNGAGGTVEVESGTARFDEGLSMDGTYVVDVGAAMVLNGGTAVYVKGNHLTGEGQYQLKGGTLQGLEDYVPNLQLLGGTVYLSPTYQTNGWIARLDLGGATLGGSSNRVVGVLNATNGSVSGALEVASNAVATLAGTDASGPTVVRGGGTLNWLGGRFGQGSWLLVQSNASINLQGSAGKDLAAPMTNFGHVVWSEGTLTVMNNNSSTYAGSVVNLGLWEMAGDVTLQQWWSTDYGTFGNGGIFRKSAGTGTGVINLPFLNSFGTIEVWSGTLRFDHGQQLDGTFVAEAGKTIRFNAGTFVFVSSKRLTGSGQYELTGGTLQGLDDFVSNLRLAGGTVYLSPTYQTNGPIMRLDIDGATLAGTNRISGVLNVNSGYVSGSLTVLSNGVLNWSGGRFTQTSSLLVASNGLANILGSAEKDMAGKMTNFGRVTWSGGMLYVMNDNSSYFGAIVNSGAWEMQGDLTLAQWWGNDKATFSNSGLLRKTAGTGIGSVGLPLVSALGTNHAVSGTLRFDNGANLDGLFTVESGALIKLNGGTFFYTSQTRVAGAGSCQLTGGTLQDLADYLPNLQLLGGSVSLSPTYQTNGTIGRLDLNGSTLLNSNRVSGVMNFLSGYVNGPMSIGSNAVLNWSSGRFAQGAALSIESNGVANLMTTGVKDLGGPLANSGLVEWTAGDLTLWNDAVTWQGAIVNSGLWEIQGDLSISQRWANNYSSFQNKGTLRKSTGTGTSTLDVVFQNQGAIEQLSGIWTFGRNFSLTEGTVLFGLAGDSNFGRINLVGTASLAGRLAARLLGGYVPATNRTFQIMSYGTVAGTFTDYGGLNVGSGRYFTPVYAATSLTLQTCVTNSDFKPIVLSNPSWDSGRFSFWFAANAGASYTVQCSTNVSPTDWRVLLITNIPVSPVRVTDTNSPPASRFYRVIASP